MLCAIYAICWNFAFDSSDSISSTVFVITWAIFLSNSLHNLRLEKKNILFFKRTVLWWMFPIISITSTIISFTTNILYIFNTILWFMCWSTYWRLLNDRFHLRYSRVISITNSGANSCPSLRRYCWICSFFKSHHF